MSGTWNFDFLAGQDDQCPVDPLLEAHPYQQPGDAQTRQQPGNAFQYQAGNAYAQQPQYWGQQQVQQQTHQYPPSPADIPYAQVGPYFIQPQQPQANMHLQMPHIQSQMHAQVQLPMQNMMQSMAQPNMATMPGAVEGSFSRSQPQFASPTYSQPSFLHTSVERSPVPTQTKSSRSSNKSTPKVISKCYRQNSTRRKLPTHSQWEIFHDHAKIFDGLPNASQWKYVLQAAKVKKPTRKRGREEAGSSASGPEGVYPDFEAPALWGPPGQPRLFKYSENGQWQADRRFTAQQIAYYVDNCPRPLHIWVQKAPTHLNHRLDKYREACRWSECPNLRGSVEPGWFRVAFDEFGQDTSTGVRDPYKVAGVMHLYCLEQCLDIAPLYGNKIFPDVRQMKHEENYAPRLHKAPCHTVLNEGYRPWFHQKTQEIAQGAGAGAGPFTPRAHKATLSYSLVKHHLRNEPVARQSTRDNRQSKKHPREIPNTIEWHKGDLTRYARTQIENKEIKDAIKTGNPIPGYSPGSGPEGMYNGSSSGNDTGLNQAQSTRQQRPAPQATQQTSAPTDLTAIMAENTYSSGSPSDMFSQDDSSLGP